MRIGMLGPFEVRDGDRVVEVPRARLRALLAALALEPGRVIPRGRLIDWVWGEDSPADSVNALQVLVSRLRKILPEGAIEAKSGGYRLAAEPDDVDTARFERLVADARGADDAERADLLRSALDLWRGDPMEGIALEGSRAFDAAVLGLAERRIAVLGDRVDAEVRLGRGADLVAELTDLVARYPLREGFVGPLMRALAEAGRGAEALEVYRQLSERLADELGADPSANLSALHTALLRGEIGAGPGPRRTNLRAELTPHIGKENDVTEVARLAAAHRLVTVTGAGGSGKTRLAAETARAVLADLPDGAWLVELGPLREGGELAQAVLTAVGLRDQTGGDALERLVDAVRDRVMLLVLDNCEHMLEAAAAFADRLLGDCPRLRIIATSREPLGITGEALWQLEPLALPAADAAPQEAAASPAVRFLRDRADAVRRNIGTDAATVAAMTRICRALDGLPLAIELAAARLRTMTLDQLADRLDDRFRLLTGGSRTALPHHRTLRAVVDWSWDLLGDAERELLRRLSVFTGGVSLEAAERVCPDGEYAFDLLAALVEKSLLLADDTPRYRMLNTIREYAAQRLAEDGGTEAARLAHLGYVTELAETADPHLRGGEQLAWLEAMDTEHDNTVAALRSAIADGRAEAAMRLVGAVGWYWYLTGHRAEGTELAVAAASLEGEVPDEVKALACVIVAMFVTAGADGDQYQAEHWITEAHRLIARSGARHPMLGFVAPLERMLTAPHDFLSAFDPLIEDEDPWVRAQSRLSRGRLRLAVGRDETGVDEDMATALAQFRALGDRWGTSTALHFLADRDAARGDFATACARFEEAVAAAGELGATDEVVGLRTRQAALYWMHGDEAASAAALAHAQRLADGITWPDTIAELTLAEAQLAHWRGDAAGARRALDAVRSRPDGEGSGIRVLAVNLRGHLAEDPEEALGHFGEAFDTAVRIGYPPMIALSLVGLAEVALRRGEHAQAARLVAAADTARGSEDRSVPDAARILEAARGRLGDKALAEAAEEGRSADWRALAEAALGR